MLINKSILLICSSNQLIIILHTRHDFYTVKYLNFICTSWIFNPQWLRRQIQVKNKERKPSVIINLDFWAFKGKISLTRESTLSCRKERKKTYCTYEGKKTHQRFILYQSDFCIILSGIFGTYAICLFTEIQSFF